MLYTERNAESGAEVMKFAIDSILVRGDDSNAFEDKRAEGWMVPKNVGPPAAIFL